MTNNLECTDVIVNTPTEDIFVSKNLYYGERMLLGGVYIPHKHVTSYNMLQVILLTLSLYINFRMFSFG